MIYLCSRCSEVQPEGVTSACYYCGADTIFDPMRDRCAACGRVLAGGADKHDIGDVTLCELCFLGPR